MAQYGQLKTLRATGTTSFGTANGAIFLAQIVTSKSTVRAIAHIKYSTTNGTSNIMIPYDSDNAATPVRKTTMIDFSSGYGVPISGKKAFIVLSGASTASNVYYQNID